LIVSQQGQITDRFTKAIEQLGAADAKGQKILELRWGGIYALERIANESERDHWPIMEVLCTYIRYDLPRSQQESTKGRPPQVDFNSSWADIQAILTVLGRRNRKYETKDEHLDLHETDLRGALFQGDFSEANLRGADLSAANLAGGDLSAADLSGAYLDWANLRGADLSAARLSGADLDGADLRAARLSGADLGGADLLSADLGKAYLSKTLGLTQQQVDKAKGDADTQLPAGLHMPYSWKK
jgi:hypothetical protein